MADQDRIAPASPLPWKVAAERSGAVVDARGWGVVEAWIGVGRDAKANAAHIVQCVNQYPSLVQQRDELLAALKPFAEQPVADDAAWCHNGITSKENCGRCGLILKARAVIARAEGAEG